MSQGDDPIDVAAFERLRSLEGEGESGFVAEVIALYLRQAPAFIDELREAIDRGDGESVFQAAHSFKSSCRHIGARQMLLLCRELESLGPANRWQEAAETLEAIEEEFDRVREALQNME